MELTRNFLFNVFIVGQHAVAYCIYKTKIARYPDMDVTQAYIF